MKSKTRASGVSRVSARHLEIDVQVFLERLVGAQLENREVVLHHVRRKARRRRPERCGEVALGVDVDGEDPLARACAASSASAAVIVLRPVPPFPATKTTRRRKQRRKIDPLTGDRAPNRR